MKKIYFGEIMCTAVRAFGNSIVDFATRCCGLPSRPSESDIRLQQICIEHLRNNQISEALSNARNIKHHYIADQTYSQIVNQSLAHPKIHEAAFQIIDYTIRDEALMAVIELNLGQKNFEKAFDLISNLSDVFKTDEFYSQIALANRLDPIGKKAALAINDPTTGEKILSVLIRAHLFNGQLITPLDLLPLINKSADAETLLKKIQSVLLNFPVHLLDNPMIEALKEAGENCSFKLQLELFETLKQKHHSHIELSSKLQQVISEIKEKVTCTDRVVDFVKSFPFGFTLGHAFFVLSSGATYLATRKSLGEFMFLGLPLILIPPILVSRTLPADKNDPIQKHSNRLSTLTATCIGATTCAALPLIGRMIASYFRVPT